MATSSVLPGAAGGAVTGQKNIGVSPLGNRGGLNQFSPNGGNLFGSGPTTNLPGFTAVSTGQPPASPLTPFGAPTQMQNPSQQPQAYGTPNAPPIAPIPPTANAPSAITTSPQQQQELQKQLVDIYGKGTGNLLNNLIGNLGSNDSSYIQAYQNAMAKQEAEGLSTIDTSLGNAGISANSSTAAIENADYISGIGAQVGLQEQQLINQQTQDLIGITQDLQKPSQEEVGTSWLDTLGQVVGVAGNIAGDVIGMDGGGGIESAISSLIPGMGRQTTDAAIQQTDWGQNLPGLDF